jgi:hypothetical protein
MTVDSVVDVAIGLISMYLVLSLVCTSINEYIARMAWWTLLLSKIAALGLTAIALSLGAPFWFDLLSKFMNIRGSGARPDRVQPAS